MRVLISVDMEGVAGVVASEDVLPGSSEYERNRGFMTDEASAAVRGVLAFDPSASVVVTDAHARFRNLIPDRLARGCTLVRGAPRRHLMLTGIDTGVDAVLLVGYHGSGGTPTSVLAHTISTASIARVRVNGVELGELGLAAALAARFGAIPALATGDDSLAREAERVVPGMRTVVVKRALGNYAAEGLHPAESCERIEAAATAALAEPAEVVPPRFDDEVDLEVDMLRPALTERASLIPGVERVAPATLGFHAADLVAAYDLIAVFAELATAP